VTNGIVRAAEEVIATTIVLGWNKSKTPFHILFGNVLNNLLDKTERMVIVLKTPSSFRQVKKINLLCPENAQYEKGFHLWLDTLIFFIRKLQLKIVVDCRSSQTLEAINHYLARAGVSKYFDLNNNEINRHISDSIHNSSSELIIYPEQ
jgi:hypothetical protein